MIHAFGDLGNFLNSNNLALYELPDSHVRFTRHLHGINWRDVAKSSTPFLHDGRIEYLLSLAGAYSINPLILIASMVVDKELRHLEKDDDFHY